MYDRTMPRALAEMETRATAEAEEFAGLLGEFFVHVRNHLERAVRPYDLPPPSAKALHLIDGSISMKELGSRIHCDGSFVTSIADTLEERGLARREIDRSDRRIKNLVLTRKGVELRSRLIHDLFDDFPGLGNLAPRERVTLMALLRKIVAAAGQADDPSGGGCVSAD
jgi:MarR family transcriptional regulator, organic hydroperoxide resistance regulator